MRKPLVKGDCVRMKKQYQRQPWGDARVGVVTATVGRDEMVSIAYKPKTTGSFVAASIFTRTACPRWANKWKKGWRGWNARFSPTLQPRR